MNIPLKFAQFYLPFVVSLSNHERDEPYCTFVLSPSKHERTDSTAPPPSTSLKWHSNSGHLEKDDIETNKFEVSYDNTKEELFKAV